MAKVVDIPRIATGVPNLDAIFNGGLPEGLGDGRERPAGLGEDDPDPADLLPQRVRRRTASSYFGTLSEPTAKTLRHLQQFSFFDPRSSRPASSSSTSA